VTAGYGDLAARRKRAHQAHQRLVADVIQWFSDQGVPPERQAPCLRELAGVADCIDAAFDEEERFARELAGTEAGFGD
jgi:hypothetical protein